jgi:hypothetical protein
MDNMIRLAEDHTYEVYDFALDAENLSAESLRQVLKEAELQIQIYRAKIVNMRVCLALEQSGKMQCPKPTTDDEINFSTHFNKYIAGFEMITKGETFEQKLVAMQQYTELDEDIKYYVEHCREFIESDIGDLEFRIMGVEELMYEITRVFELGIEKYKTRVRNEHIASYILFIVAIVVLIGIFQNRVSIKNALLDIDIFSEKTN